MKKTAVYRPYSSGTVAAPLQIRSAGQYRVPESWNETPMVKHFLELFWCIAGSGEFRHGDTGYQLNAEEIFFYLPGDCHRISSKSAGFEYCWLTVDGPELESVIRGFGIERGILAAGRCPEALFLQLMEELRGIGRDSEFRAGAVAYEILTQAMIGPRSRDDRFIRRFRELIEQRYDDPALSVVELTRELGVHRSTLTRQVSRECGTSPQEFLTSYRLQVALEMLKNEKSASIKEVAEATGFSDQNYFSKVFSKRLGKSPSEFRKLL